MTPTTLALLAGLHAAATPGAWEACSASGGRCSCGFVHSVPLDGPVARTAFSEEDWPDFAGGTPKDVAANNAALIAAAVNALPALLAESAVLAEAVGLLRRARRSVAFIAASRPDMIAGSVDDYSDIAAFLALHLETP